MQTWYPSMRRSALDSEPKVPVETVQRHFL